jgi:1,4-alpha-glucan branching enzyme
MQQAEIDAIVGGYHSDAFSILGPHVVDEGFWEIRAFRPGAPWLTAVVAGVEHPMEMLHPRGFFRVRLPAGEAGRSYTFRFETFPDKNVAEAEDPYRFPPLLSSFELHLHGEGTNFESYKTLGAHLVQCDGVPGVRFAVWAPTAEVVTLAGDFNGWSDCAHPMRLRDGGIWEFFYPHLGAGALYKYSVQAPGGRRTLKCDPYAFATELPPKTASIVHNPDLYVWGDGAWMEARGQKNWLTEPMSIYEVHLESWIRDPENRVLNYRDLAHRLAEYVNDMGFTHVELMPIAEHPYSGSWGYQVTGYYAPTSRFGSPDDFRYFVDHLHRKGIGILVDWVPAHFPRDSHGLAKFDGTALYEHDDPRQGEHRDWGTLIFNFGRNEVRTFLISNALFLLREYHIDGLRVDAVASMLYLDYSRKEGEWIPNRFGGRENLEAMDFLRRFNELAHEVPGAITIAEESTSFPLVSRPVYTGGLGFTMKWNMGWMHDMFHYFQQDPVYRKYHQNNITFSLVYAFSENFVLPVSHDEVVHGKSPLIGKMPGDEWRRFANVRSFLGYMFSHPGKKLMFMGCEIGQTSEWNYQRPIPWDLLNYPVHRGLQMLVRDLNFLLRSESALHEVDFHWEGFEWVDFHDVDSSVISFHRYSKNRRQKLLFVCNFTPQVRHNYRLHVNHAGHYRQILNTDHKRYGGSGVDNAPVIDAQPSGHPGRPFCVTMTLPPLAVTGFRIEDITSSEKGD